MNYNKLNKKELIALLTVIENNSKNTISQVQEEKEIMTNGFTEKELQAIELEHKEIIRIIEGSVK